MESNHGQEHHSSTSASVVFEIPGEPAIVINGVPDSNSTEETTPSFNISATQEPLSDPGFGRWLEGREVKKLFDGVVYSGIVTKFDKETEWYIVEYEDGDTEDLTWTELEPVLQPLEVAIPLKTLAQKVLKRSQKGQRIGKVGRARKIIASSQLGNASSET